LLVDFCGGGEREREREREGEDGRDGQRMAFGRLASLV